MKSDKGGKIDRRAETAANKYSPSLITNLRLAPAAVEIKHLQGGGAILKSPVELKPYPRHLCEHLRHWAREESDRVFLAERN